MDLQQGLLLVSAYIVFYLELVEFFSYVELSGFYNAIRYLSVIPSVI
jgi:hypothetical protein